VVWWNLIMIDFKCSQHIKIGKRPSLKRMMLKAIKFKELK
jgi:hypothetical protein